jgi:hypothetical protein
LALEYVFLRAVHGCFIPEIRHCAETYNIGGGDVRVCTFTLFKHVFRLGENVLGLFDFQGATLACHHVCDLLWRLASGMNNNHPA